MKQFYLHGGAGMTVMILANAFLSYFPSVFNIQGGVRAMPLLFQMAAGICCGFLLELPQVLGLYQGRERLTFNRQILLGQGPLALMLAYNVPLVRYLSASAVPDVFYRWLGGYPAAFSLFGFTWLGIVIIKTTSPQPIMFHVKQRRRKR